jgi:DNA-binding NtrC family response regulator
MTGMDGIETLKQIRESAPGAVAIVMTGYPTIESSIEALRHGACDYVIKPFKLNELKSSIENALEGHKFESEIDKLKGRITELESELKKVSDFR